MDAKPIILIAEDNVEVARLFGAKLASAGFEILYAHDGNEGREMARRFKPRLILLDIHMPVMDGVTAAEHLRGEKETKDIPLVFLTNDDFSFDAEELAKKMLVVDYIHKSIDLNEFVERVKRILEQHEKSSVGRMNSAG